MGGTRIFATVLALAAPAAAQFWNTCVVGVSGSTTITIGSGPQTATFSPYLSAPCSAAGPITATLTASLWTFAPGAPQVVMGGNTAFIIPSSSPYGGTFTFLIVPSNYALGTCAPYCANPFVTWATLTVVVPGPPPPPPPTISAVVPDEVPATGGTVTILGSNLNTATAVAVGGAPTTWSAQGSGALTCVVPAGTAGPTSIVVLGYSLFTGASTTVHRVPSLIGATPSAVPPGGGLGPVVLSTAGFDVSTRLFLNGVELPFAPLPNPGDYSVVIPATAAVGAGAAVFEAFQNGYPTRVSPPLIVPLTGSSNVGAVVARPVGAAPGTFDALKIFGLPPNAPTLLALDPTPIFALGFPSPLENFALEVGSPTMTVLADGLIGGLGPPLSADAAGRAALSVSPPPAVLGFVAKAQAAYFDATAPGQFRLTFGFPLSL